MAATVTAITAVRLTTTDPERLARFDVGLGFEVGGPEAVPAEEMELLGLRGGGTRLPLRLGD